MAFDDFDDSFNNRARDSFNNTTTTNANLNVGIENAGNVDESVTDSGNTDIGIDGSFTNDSNDTNTASWVDDSYNTVDNSLDVDASDNSVNGSYNQWLDESTNDSGNSFSWSRVDDHSTNVGNREYNTGFAGGGGDGGDGRATIVDQSVNQNIDAFGVDQFTMSDAVVASGDGAIAAGDDVTITQSLDDSTNFTADGDINMNNTTTVDTVIGSYNTTEDNSVVTDASEDWHIHDSFNDYSDNYEATNSFNDEIAISSDTDWDIDANVIWDSSAAIIADGSDVDLPPV